MLQAQDLDDLPRFKETKAMLELEHVREVNCKKVRSKKILFSGSEIGLY